MLVQFEDTHQHVKKIMEAETWKQLVTLRPQSGSKEQWRSCSACFFLFIQSRNSAMEWCCPHLGETFLPQLTSLDHPPQRCPEACFHGDAQAHQTSKTQHPSESPCCSHS